MSLGAYVAILAVQLAFPSTMYAIAGKQIRKNADYQANLSLREGKGGLLSDGSISILSDFLHVGLLVYDSTFCAVAVMRDHSLCIFFSIDSAVAVQMDGAVLLL